MWNVKHRQRNSYLQSRVRIMNPQLLNQCVETAMRKPTTILSKSKIIKSQLIPLEPKNFGPVIDCSKAQLAYGLSGLPKILREISYKDKNIQYKALNTLTDLLMNSLECSRAINDFNVVKKLETVLLQHMPETRETMPAIDKILKSFEILASNFDGAWRMVSQFELVQTLYYLIRSSNCTKLQPARILMLMSSHPTVADVMLIHGHLKHIADLIERIDRIKDVYIHLSNLLKRAPASGMEAGLFGLLFSKMLTRNTVQPAIVKCFALLLSTPQGHEEFDKIDGVKLLYEMLKGDNLGQEVLEYVALAFQNCTINKRTLWRCREFWDLPLILIRRAHSRKSDHMQLYCIQTLRQITTVPSVKDFVRKTCKKQITAIECRTEFVREAKQRLLQWLRKKNYINIEPSAEIDADKDEEIKSEKSLSESESESCIRLETSSTDTSKLESELGREPNPIAYRLDYGKVCHKRIEEDSDSGPMPSGLTTIPIGERTFYANVMEKNFYSEFHGDEIGPIGGTIVEVVDTATIIGDQRVHNSNESTTPLLTVPTDLTTNIPNVATNAFPLHVERHLASEGITDYIKNLAYMINNQNVLYNMRDVSHLASQQLEPFILMGQRTAFISSPPRSRAYIAVARGGKRREGVITRRSQS